ncbi:MAG: response regulator [Thalassovita sp.]|nr:response regulator [Thalassovita sp.]
MFIVAFVCASLFQFIWVPRVTKILIQAETREIHRQAEVIADGLTPFILSNQSAAIYENLNSIGQRHSDWYSIVLTRADQRQLYPMSRVEPETGANVISLSHDIVLRGDLWGRLEVHADLSAQIAQLHDELRRLGVFTIVVVLISGATLGLFVDRLITRRLVKLADAADQLGSGNYEAELPRPGQDEVGRLTKSFSAMRSHIIENVSSLEAARREAENALKVKSQFLATMSHELRTPLNGIVPVAEMLMASDLDTGQRKDVETIQKASKSLLHIVDDILDLTKLEEGRLEPRKKPFDIADLVTEVATMLQASAKSKGLELVSDIDVSVAGRYAGDGERIKQILVNLVGNAIKFTRSGTVTIRCRSLAEGQGHTRFLFEVEDTGIGIAETDQNRVFERFEQAEGGLTRRFGGSGLGLSIAKNLVFALGGDIGLNSKLGDGSTFWFSLPLEKTDDAVAEPPIDAARPECSPAPAQHETCRPLDILIADDNEINRSVTTLMLEKMGHNVIAVENGRDAFDKVATTDFDVVFMDVHMPDMDGLEATRRIRKLPSERAGTFVVALTASVMEQDVLDCREAGMDDFLSKPLSSAAIAKSLEAASI